MIQVCYVCWKKYGEKEPLKDRSETHGICNDCFPGELKKIAEIKRKRAGKVGDLACPQPQEEVCHHHPNEDNTKNKP